MSHKVTLPLALIAALAFSGAASSVYAQNSTSQNRATSPRVVDSTTGRTNQRGLQWNSDGRWGLNLNVEQPAEEEADWNDVDAGAYYRLSPSLRLRGSVALGEQNTNPAQAPEQQREQPRVRLETIFRF